MFYNMICEKFIKIDRDDNIIRIFQQSEIVKNMFLGPLFFVIYSTAQSYQITMRIYMLNRNDKLSLLLVKDLLYILAKS